MMKFKSIFTLLAIFIIPLALFGQDALPKPAAASSVAKTPTVTQILDKYVKAIGGRDAYMKFKSRTMQGTVELTPMGVKGTMESFAAAPDKLLTKINLSGIGEVLDGYDGKVAWTVNPIQGSRVKSGQELLQVKSNGSFYREVELDKTYSKLDVEGMEKIGNKTAYIVSASSASIPAETLYFDAESGLLLRHDTTSITPEGSTAVKNYYEDYRDSDGIKLPFKIRAVTPSFEIVTLITEIKNGPPIEDTKFSRPK
jgi:zinc protease